MRVSRENLEVARAGVARFSAKDIAGVAELYSPDAFVIAPENWPEGGRFEGRDAVIGQYMRILEEWGSHSMWIDRERSGGDWVVLRLIWNAEGRTSGAPIAMSIVGAYRVEVGKIVEGRFFWDFDEALNAVGLQ